MVNARQTSITWCEQQPKAGRLPDGGPWERDLNQRREVTSLTLYAKNLALLFGRLWQGTDKTGWTLSASHGLIGSDVQRMRDQNQRGFGMGGRVRGRHGPVVAPGPRVAPPGWARPSDLRAFAALPLARVSLFGLRNFRKVFLVRDWRDMQISGKFSQGKRKILFFKLHTRTPSAPSAAQPAPTPYRYPGYTPSLVMNRMT